MIWTRSQHENLISSSQQAVKQREIQKQRPPANDAAGRLRTTPPEG